MGPVSDDGIVDVDVTCAHYLIRKIVLTKVVSSFCLSTSLPIILLSLPRLVVDIGPSLLSILIRAFSRLTLLPRFTTPTSTAMVAFV